MDIAILLLPASGLFAGVLLGFIARRNFFCTLSSLEQYWFAGNSSGLRTWVLASALAALFTQTLVFAGLADTSQAVYLTPSFGWLGAIFGGLMFGVGMALVGTCGFGALVRLGGGSLKSLMAILVMGICALSALKGLLALGRIGIFEPFIIDFSFAGDQSIPAIISALTGLDLQIPATATLIALPIAWVFYNRDYRTNTKSIFTAIGIAAVVSFGWYVTSAIADISFEPVQIESASFSAPVADTLLQFTVFIGARPDYGVGMVVGTILGAAIAARSADDVRWEACDDARELSRHIIGAACMGFGGVLALGCTIGQGVSAASLLAISAPVTLVFIGIGAKFGLVWLLEGSVTSVFRR